MNLIHLELQIKSSNGGIGTSNPNRILTIGDSDTANRCVVNLRNSVNPTLRLALKDQHPINERDYLNYNIMQIKRLTQVQQQIIGFQ